MNVNDEGYVTGSVDVSKLDEIEPKSDEAKAQLAALKADRDASVKAVAEAEAAQSALVAEQAGVPAAASAEGQQSDAAKPAAQAAPAAQPAQSEDVTALQSEAAAAGVTVDKRWGADRLRQEIAAANAKKG
jgi:hypothetical protein